MSRKIKNCEVNSEHRFVWHGRWTDTKIAKHPDQRIPPAIETRQCHTLVVTYADCRRGFEENNCKRVLVDGAKAFGAGSPCQGRLALREQSMIGGRIQKKARGDSPGSFALRAQDTSLALSRQATN